MKYVTFIILNKILINIPYSLLLFLNIFLTYFAISGYFHISLAYVSKELLFKIIALYIGLLSLLYLCSKSKKIILICYCPLYRATFTQKTKRLLKQQ